MNNITLTFAARRPAKIPTAFYAHVCLELDEEQQTYGHLNSAHKPGLAALNAPYL